MTFRGRFEGICGTSGLIREILASLYSCASWAIVCHVFLRSVIGAEFHLDCFLQYTVQYVCSERSVGDRIAANFDGCFES